MLCYGAFESGLLVGDEVHGGALYVLAIVGIFPGAESAGFSDTGEIVSWEIIGGLQDSLRSAWDECGADRSAGDWWYFQGCSSCLCKSESESVFKFRYVA